MTEPASDTWDHRDLPVLRSIVAGIDRGAHMTPDAIVEETGIDEDQVTIAIEALESDGLVIGAPRYAGGIRFVSKVSGEARRKAGSWPTPETGVGRLIAALQDIAENSDSEDHRTRAQKALDALTGAGKQIAVSVASAVITGQVT